METLFRDLRLATRSLARTRAFTAVAVLCLALGIGADSAIFSIVDAVLFRPLPYHHAEQVEIVYNRFRTKDTKRVPASGYEYFDIRDHNRSFQSVAAVIPRYLNLTGDGDPERLVGARASADFFPLLGVDAQIGRTFLPEEDSFGAEGVVVLADGFWRRRFAGDPGVVGRKLLLDGQPFTVVGVLPKDFRFGPVVYEAFIPIAIDMAHLPPRNARGLTVVARRAPGVSHERAQEDMDRLAARFREQYPDLYPDASGYGLEVVRARDDLVGDVRPALLALFGAAALVLLVACVNVANLLLARATAREKEVGIRSAVGAGRWALTRQFLAEGLVLSGAAAVLGLALAWAIPKVLIAASPARVPRLDEVHLNLAVLGFTVAVAVVTGVVFGLVPVLRSYSAGLTQVLKEGGKTSGGSSRGGRVRSALVAGEIAVALVVLICAALMVQSFRKLERVDPGFRTADLLTFRLFLAPNQFTDPERSRLVEEVVGKLRALPSVEQAGAVSHLPLGLVDTEGELEVEGRAVRPDEGNPTTGWRMATPGYFQAMDIRLLSGRGFTASDDASATGVVVLDQDLARRLYPDENPIGRRLALLRFDGSKDWRTVVGVVGHVAHHALGEPGGDQLYVPYAQYPFPVASIVLHTSVDPLALSADVRRVVGAVDPDLPLLGLEPMADYVAATISDQKLDALLFGGFAGVALLLALAGVYGVMAYSVAQRTREFGLRVALGAGRSDVGYLVIRRALLLSAAGLAVGLLAAAAVVRWIESLLFGVSATDVATYLGGGLALCLLTLLASYVPALRATRVDPAIALRAE